MNGELVIAWADNGFTVSWWEEREPDPIKHRMAFEIDYEKESGEVECLQRMLYYIVEHFGMTGSKHDKYRIRISTGGEGEAPAGDDGG